MEALSFHFGSGESKIDPKLDSLFKNSVPAQPKVTETSKKEEKQEKEIEKKEKKEKKNKKKENKKEKKDTKKAEIEANNKEGKKRKREEEEEKEEKEVDDESETNVEEENKEKTEKELIEEQYRKQFVHEALKTEKGKNKKKEKKEKENKKDEEEEELPKKKKRKVKDEPEKLERTLFVGNLDKNVTEKANLKKLKNLFKKYGNIESIRFRSVAFSKNLPKKIAFITKEFHPERDCLNAYIVFENKESAEKALELNGSLFNEKHMRVDLEGRDKKLDEKKSVFVGNLAFDEQEETLWKAFSDCGEVVNVRIVRDAKTNLGKGFGYVTFKERSSVSLALELNDTTVGKRKIRVFRCKNLKKEDENMMKEGEHAIKNKKIAKMIKGPRTKKRWTNAQKKQNAIKKQKKLLKKASKQNK